MRAVVQRVSRASVAVAGQVAGAIDEAGLLVLVGVTYDDTPEQAAKLAAKLWGLRILDGENAGAKLAPICGYVPTTNITEADRLNAYFFRATLTFACRLSFIFRPVADSGIASRATVTFVLFDPLYPVLPLPRSIPLMFFRVS